MTIHDELIDLMSSCRDDAEYMNSNVSRTEGDPRGTCFWYMYNRIKITEEIISVYDKRWNPDILCKLDESSISEIHDRIVTVTRDMFVDIVSAIEKGTKDCLKMYPSSGIKESTLKKANRLYLRNIMLSSCEAGVITENDLGRWDDVLLIRNLAVHENSVSDRTTRLAISDIEIIMRAGRMMKGPLDTYIVLTESALKLFYDWLISMHERFNRP